MSDMKARARAILDATPHAATCEVVLDLGARTYSCSCDRHSRAMLQFANECVAAERARCIEAAIGFPGVIRRIRSLPEGQ
jgi:hypothetical protein